MAAARNRLSCLRSMCSSVKFANQIDIRPSFTNLMRDYHTKEIGSALNFANNGFGMVGVNSNIDRQNFSGNCAGALWFKPLNMGLWRGAPFLGIGNTINYRGYASGTSGQGSTPQAMNIQASSDASGVGMSDGGNGGNDWGSKIKEVWQSAVDTASYTGEKAKEASNEMTPYVQQLFDTYPYLRDVIVPVGGTLVGTLMAWVVMPKILRRFHKYSTQGPAALLAGSSVWGPVPYEKSFWSALEDPVRYLITFMAFSQIATMVAPTTIASQYITQAWRGAFIVSFVWFLHRWKENVITRLLTLKSLEGVDRDKLLTLDKFSSVGLFVIGLMALAEACGVAVQSILTVGGIGGIATAFAARDVLGNVLSGLSVQISRPFSVGDTIKAGSVEGQVVEMGLTTTSLLTAEKFPAIVPNSLFSSQVIVNKSRAQWRAVVSKIPLQIDDFGKIPQISDDIKSMLRSHSNVSLEREAPYCFLSRIERSYAELTLGCNLNNMSKDKLYAAEQDILLQSVRIIRDHGATLGSTLEDTIN